MKSGKKTLMFGTLLFLCLISFGLTIQAKPDRVEINFEYIWESYGSPEREWFTDSGIYHSIMTPHYGVVIASDSDFTGDVYYIGNLVLFDPALFEGLGQGILELTGTYNGMYAGFDARMHFKIENFMIIGKINGHGYGAFEGNHIKGTFVAALGGVTSVQMFIWN